MDHIDTKDGKTRGLALFGLRAGKAPDAAVGNTPSIEELSALYDGTLDDTRRAQLLSHIAADPAVYRAWVEIAQAQTTLEADFNESASEEAQTDSVLKRLGDWLSGSFRIPALSGGIAAAALVAVMLLPSLNTPDGDIGALGELDQIYADYGQTWNSSPALITDRQVRSVSGKAAAEPEQQAIHAGMLAGLGELGDAFPQKWLPQINTDDSASTLPTQLHEALTDTGKLATLARFKCQLQGETAFFSAAEKLMDSLRATEGFDKSKTGSYLARTIDQPGEPMERVCEFSVAAVAALTRKP